MIQFVSNILMVCLFVYLGFFTLHIFLQSLKVKNSLKNYYYGIAAYFLFFIISQSMFVVNDISFAEELFIYDLLYLFGNFLGHIGLLLLMFVVEKNISNKLKFIPTIIIMISAIFEIIFFDYMILFIIILLLTATLIPIIYIRVAIQTTGKTRNKGLLHGFGLILFMLGILFNTYFLLNISIVFYILGPVMEIIGAAMFHYALLFYGKSK